MYPICSLHNIDFRRLPDKHELMHEKLLLDSADLVLSDSPDIVCSGGEGVYSRYDVLILESMTDIVVLCKPVMRPGTHGHPFCSAF